MITFVSCIFAMAIYIWLGVLAFKLSWGFIKVLFFLIFSPLIFFGLIIAGVMYGAFALILIMGIIALVGSFA